METEVIVILFRDVRIEGVEAAVAIPEGQTAEQVYEQWLKAEADRQLAEEDERPGIENLMASFPYEEMTIETLPAILPLPIEDTGPTFDDLIGDHE
jgi:hypothetical protein